MQPAGFLFLFFLLPFFFFFFSPILVISFPPCLDISDTRCLYLIFSWEMLQLSSLHTYIPHLNTPRLTSPYSSISSASAISTPSSCVFRLMEGFF